MRVPAPVATPAACGVELALGQRSTAQRSMTSLLCTSGRRRHSCACANPPAGSWAAVGPLQQNRATPALSQLPTARAKSFPVPLKGTKRSGTKSKLTKLILVCPPFDPFLAALPRVQGPAQQDLCDRRQEAHLHRADRAPPLVRSYAQPWRAGRGAACRRHAGVRRAERQGTTGRPNGPVCGN